jgi:UDP-N-acetylglucosamine--N-acetylmuramyl-(pentapeptide) pyrophosphoryl-undecaprenol N-acetylglucosamine transferase
MSIKAHIVIVGGGTGGHFYPLMSIVDRIRSTHFEHTRIIYMGPNEYDRTSLNERNIQFSWCPSGKIRRYPSVRNVIDSIILFFGIFVALVKLYIFYPDIVISKGGYTSVPIVLAAALLKIPIIVHESDSVPGRANKIASHFAHSVFVAYHEMETGFNGIRAEYVGIPMRSELLQPPKQKARELIGIKNDDPVILVLGGSQGAETINQLILDYLTSYFLNTISSTKLENLILT